MGKSDFKLLFGQIDYISVSYYLFLPLCVVLYYLIPKKWRWVVLLVGSGIFYYLLFPKPKQTLVFLASIVISWGAGLVIRHWQRHRHLVLFSSIVLSTLPLLIWDGCKMFTSMTRGAVTFQHLIVPVGLSFYTLQMIAYLVDIYKEKIVPERNPFRYALFISFFPQLLQGPIPRYEDLQHQLMEGHSFNPANIHRGFQLIVWGFFLKFMIADKAGVVVNTIFNNYKGYSGCYFLVAGILYSIQLYTDFRACTTISQGSARLFGIQLSDNFDHPYFSRSAKEFWRRWHMSLSFWLRDYIYIPLGGSRHGKRRKYINLLFTFLVSGFWHGGTMKFVFWGLLHGVYQVAGTVLEKPRNQLYIAIGIPSDSQIRRILEMLVTFFWVMLAWIIFRADRLTTGLYMIYSIFTTFNPWVFTGQYLFTLGLNQSEWTVLLLSILLLVYVSHVQERGTVIGLKIMSQPLVIRYILYIAAISCIWICGTYGFGFNAQDFIYRGF